MSKDNANNVPKIVMYVNQPQNAQNVIQVMSLTTMMNVLSWEMVQTQFLIMESTLSAILDVFYVWLVLVI